MTGDSEPGSEATGGAANASRTGMHLDHVGIATNDAADLADLYGDLLGCDRVHEESFDGMWIVFLELGAGTGTFLELLEPREDGPIDSYLKEHGSGIHHVAFETADIDTALDRARDYDVDLVDETPREGAWGHDVAFLHPGSTGGVLIEFVEH